MSERDLSTFLLVGFPMNHGRPNTLLKLVNLETVFDNVIRVLKGVSLVVPQAGIVTPLRANGAGKTITLKTITGWVRL
jgi:branched-chain amino acid transport system ATP-binding protein